MTEMQDKTLDQLAVDMYTRADALPHLMAEAEIARRLAIAQLDAAKAMVDMCCRDWRVCRSKSAGGLE
jgi:hypothetical protein